jgi:hypothetical protein
MLLIVTLQRIEGSRAGNMGGAAFSTRKAGKRKRGREFFTPFINGMQAGRCSCLTRLRLPTRPAQRQGVHQWQRF